MARRLSQNLNSDFIAAANRMRGRGARQKIVVYVESYEDIFFWSNLLRPLETEQFYFEVMLPSRSTLCKGKKMAMANDLGPRLGGCMIACVDADYDYLMQGATETSAELCHNPYIFHTYYYAIENYQCYAPALHEVCVMATLNDRKIFDFDVSPRPMQRTIEDRLFSKIEAYFLAAFSTTVPRRSSMTRCRRR